jgi:hypothetical protein
MPTYSNAATPLSIGPGDSAVVIAPTDTLSATFKSAQVALQHTYAGIQQRLSVEIAFSGAPGTFSVTLQTSDTDLDANYNTEGTIANAQMNTNNVARLEVPQVTANFARLLFTALANSVTATAKLTA